jgi:hypothetical protein
MIKSIIIGVLLLVILLILIYKNKLSVFNNTIFKSVVGYISITMILSLTLKFVKVLPLFLKVGVLGIDFILIYLIFTTLISNNKS